MKEVKEQTHFIFSKLYFFFMDFPALLVTVFLSSFLMSVTLYSFYVGFGPQATDLRDPFLEHED